MSSTIMGRRPQRLTATKAKLAGEIRQTLRDRGGSAHREVVIGAILLRRGVTGQAADKTRRALLSAFELHVDPEPDSEAQRLFRLPFGPDSHRWALHA